MSGTPKPFLIAREWRIRDDVLSGVLDDDTAFAERIIEVLKEAEDAVVVETADRFYLLDPPGQL